ncbi:hypothetical protein Hdeb2414_s0212g00835231 [Helianthus debilis subsp. tardiflorus]
MRSKEKLKVTASYNDLLVTPRKISSNNVLTRIIRVRYVKTYFRGTKSDKQ